MENVYFFPQYTYYNGENAAQRAQHVDEPSLLPTLSWIFY